MKNKQNEILMNDVCPKSGPKVSIIIPVFNGANYLSEAIESVLSQTYQNIEIIVVNDGSNDNGATEAVAHVYGDKIRYYSKPNGGVASALNTGISQMRGEFFSWLSHDDLYVKDKVELQIKTFFKINRPNIVLYTNYAVFTDDPSKCVFWDMKKISPSEFRYWITIENCLHGCTLLIPKSAFEDCGVFDEKLRTTQDYDLWFRIAMQYQFIHMPVSLVKSRSHSEQGSIKMREIALNECNKLLSNFVRQLGLSEIQQAAYCSPGLAYAQLASSMWYRGFFPAGRTSFQLSIKHSINAPFKEIVLAQCILMKGVVMYNLVKPMRKLIPPILRLNMRKILKFIGAMVKPASPSIKNEEYTVLETMTLKEKFSAVYEHNMFKGRISRSGEGSDLVQTAVIRTEIPKLLTEYNIKSLLDAPCGDWYWMKETQLNIPQYIGVDIVDALIQKNQQEYGNERVNFACVNLVTDNLPKADLIFSRDCLVHLLFEQALKIIQNFKHSGAKYLLTTTFTNRELNEDLGEGFWRTLNMQIAPFHFPAPLKLINEQCTEGDNQFTDKCLGLWRLEDLPCG